jgi:DNA-binding NarL/FixJ family response regulator
VIRVLLADDQALFREGLATLLSRIDDIDVVGEAANGQEALALMASLRPQIVLMDLRMPVMDGVEATRQIRRRYDFCHVLVLTTFDDDELVLSALGAGASGYLLKDSRVDQLAEAIRAASRGQTVLPPSVASIVVSELNRLTTPRAGEAELLEGLTGREREVLRLLGTGLSNKGIAQRLNLAEGTVKNYMTNILAKLEVHDRTQAVLKAQDLGLIHDSRSHQG